MNRRDFLRTGALAGAVAASGAWTPSFAKPRSRLRLGMIGTGLRGQTLLGSLVKRDDVEMVALCDIEPIMLGRAAAMVEAVGKPKPALFGADGDVHGYRRLLDRGDLDGVIIATPWEWHAPMAIDAMEARIPVGCEVVAGLSMQDHWDVLRTQQRTGTPYMLLENVCYRRDVMAALNMARQGVFGELVHLEGGYQHDLRGVKFNSGNPDEPYDSGAEYGDKGWSEARWRTQHSIERDGDLYPSHGIGPCAHLAHINRGNRFTRISSFSSKARGLSDYLGKKAGPEHPNQKLKFALGDVVTTQIACENGETILLSLDVSLPRPYSLGFRVQGTDGLWMDLNKGVHIEGKSPPHKWDPAEEWFAKYDHPLWKKHAETAAGAGHGGMDWFVLNGFVEALKAGDPMPIDIYDAVAWSAITPLSEQSIAEGFATLDFPDFTEGKWKVRKPVFALDDRY